MGKADIDIAKMEKFLAENGGSVSWGHFSNRFRNVPKRKLHHIFSFSEETKNGMQISVKPGSSSEKRLKISVAESSHPNEHNHSKEHCGFILDDYRGIKNVPASFKEITITSLLPTLEYVVSKLTEWKNSDASYSPQTDIKRWLSKILFEIWYVVSLSKSRDALWMTVQQHLYTIFNFEAFDFSRLDLNSLIGQEINELCVQIPENFYKGTIEDNILRSFENFVHFCCTGQYVGEYRRDQQGRLVTLNSLEIAVGCRKEAKKRFSRCNPLEVEIPLLSYGRVRSVRNHYVTDHYTLEDKVMFYGTIKCDGNDDKVVHFNNTGLGSITNISKGQRVSFVAKLESGCLYAKEIEIL